MIKINVIIKDRHWLNYIKDPAKYLKEKFSKLNKEKIFKKKKNYDLTIVLSNSEQIRLLNKRFRGKNKSTDVLSFPSYEKKDLKKIILKSKSIYLGDIIINIKKLNRSSDENIFKFHFDKLWIHSLLHLFGYKHRLNTDFKKMGNLEKKFIKRIN